MIDKILKDIKGLFKVQDKAKFLKQNIPYLAFFYVGNIFSHHVRAYNGGYVIAKIFQGILELNTMSFIPSIYPTDMLMGVGLAALIKFIVYTKGKNAKKFRQGKKDIEPYREKKQVRIFGSKPKSSTIQLLSDISSMKLKDKKRTCDTP